MKKKRGFRYELFCIWWFWKNRKWKDTRQKMKAFNRDCEKLGW